MGFKMVAYAIYLTLIFLHLCWRARDVRKLTGNLRVLSTRCVYVFRFGVSETIGARFLPKGYTRIWWFLLLYLRIEILTEIS